MVLTAGAGAALFLIGLLSRHIWPAGESVLETPATEAPPRPLPAESTDCLPSGDGFLQARLDGALQMRLDWKNHGTQCDGMPRPEGNGIRMSFSRALDGEGRQLLIVFGIAGLSESSSGRGLPANLTIIEEGGRQVFGTLGDDKCVVDQLEQQLITPWSPTARTYRVSGRGFCMQPAREVGGDESVLMSSFDFAGQVRYGDPIAHVPDGRGA
jgi:hypothetical protein